MLIKILAEWYKGAVKADKNFSVGGRVVVSFVVLLLIPMFLAAGEASGLTSEPLFSSSKTAPLAEAEEVIPGQALLASAPASSTAPAPAVTPTAIVVSSQLPSASSVTAVSVDTPTPTVPAPTVVIADLPTSTPASFGVVPLPVATSIQANVPTPLPPTVPTDVPTFTPTPSPTPTYTSTPTATPTTAATSTPIQSPVPSATPPQTPVPTLTVSPSQTPVPTLTASPSQTPTSTVTPSPTPQLSGSVSPVSGMVVPGGSITYTFTITNTGTDSDVVDASLVVSGSQTFSYQLLDKNLSLAAGASGDVRVVASAATNAPANAAGRMTLTASTQSGRLAPVIISSDVAIADRRGFDISVAPKEMTADYGTPVFYTIVITNTGSARENATISTSQEITKFINTLDPRQPAINLAPGEVVSRTLIVTPNRLITKGFMKKMAANGAKKFRMTNEELELFKITTRRFDTTQVTLSNKDISTSTVVTTTSKPPDIKKMQKRANAPDGIVPSHDPTVTSAPLSQQDQGVIGWLLGRLNGLLSSATDLTGRAVAWIGGTTAIASPSESPSYAGGTPHDRNNTTCGYCHEVHGAREGSASTGGTKLLPAWSPNRYNSGDTSTVIRPLCDTCHNGYGGSKYNVEGGTVTVSSTVTSTLGGPLKNPALGTTSPITVGEVFSYTAYPAVMSNTVDFVPSNPVTNSLSATATVAVSTAHGIEATIKPPYSITDTLSPNYIAADNFTCTKCHDQHGNTTNPRLIRQTITFGGVSTTVNFNWTYQTSTAPELVTPTSGSTNLCYACHNDQNALRHAGGHGGTNYTFPISMSTTTFSDGTYDTFSSNGGGVVPTSQYPAEYDSGTGLYRNMVCLTCHKGHGTTNSPGATASDLPLGREEFFAFELTSGFGWCNFCHTPY